MKAILYSIAMLGAACCAAQGESVVSASVSLKDGSTVKGEFLAQKISGSTVFANQLALDPAIIKSLTFTGTNGEAKVELVNKDAFTMKVADASFKLKSSLGELSFPRSSLKSLSLSTKKVGGVADEGLVFYCTFDGPDSIINPEVGPQGRYLNASFVEGRSGNAMLAPAYTPCASFPFPPDFFGRKGCIEFWAKIQKNSSNVSWGGDPRLYTLSIKNSGETISTIDIVSNNGAGNSGLATWTILGNTASIGGMPSLSYSDILQVDNWRAWHHYAVIWDEDGIEGLAEPRKIATLVDGKLMPAIKTDWRDSYDIEKILAKTTLLSFTHDPDRSREHNTKSPFLIDDFKIWNYAKTDFAVE